MTAPRPRPAPPVPALMASGPPPRPAVRPLWTISGATAWLRKHPDDVLLLVEDGRLEWAWDIAAGAGHRRREIRIWFESLEAARLNPGQTVSELTNRLNFTPAEVITRIIGHQRPTLRGSEVQALLNCDRNLVARHLKSGALRLASRVATRRCHTPLILRDSLVNFFLDRRVQ